MRNLEKLEQKIEDAFVEADNLLKQIPDQEMMELFLESAASLATYYEARVKNLNSYKSLCNVFVSVKHLNSQMKMLIPEIYS